MKLAAPEFEKRFRALHRAELARSPELRKQYRAGRRNDAAALSRIGRKLLLPVLWVVIPASLMIKEGQASLAFAVISLWTAGSAFRWAQRWFQQFYGSEDLVVLSNLPVNDEQIFSFSKHRFFRSFGWVFWELSIAYLMLTLFPAGSRPPLWILPLLAAAQSGLILAMALHLASWLHILPLGAIGGLLRTGAIVLLLWGINAKNSTDAANTAAHWIFPTGWLNYLAFQSTVRGDLVALILLLPIGALLVASTVSWNRLRSFYSLEGLEIMPAQNVPNGPDHEELTEASFGPRRGPTEIEDAIAERHFLEGVNWETSGPLERFVARLLTPRDRTVAEFLVGSRPGWSASLKFAVVVWAVASLVVAFFGKYGGAVVFFSAYILLTASLPLFGGDWLGLRQTPSGGVFLASYSVFPIAFNEIVSVLAKVNLTRIVAASPLVLSFAALAAQALEHSAWSGVVFALHCLGILLALQPLFVLFPISRTTNDVSRARALWLIIFLPLVLLLVAGAASIFFLDSALARFGVLVGMLAVSFLSLVIYRWAYRAGRFDLVTRRDQEA